MESILSNITVIKGDITTFTGDAIVNAANTSLLGGGGVDGAIHRAAGPKLFESCRAFNGCEPGEARITPGFNLKARYVIHTPGPVYKNGNQGEEAVLTACYINSLRLAIDNQCTTIAFPAISTGVYCYPKELACNTALSAVTGMIEQHRQLAVTFFLFDNENYNIYTASLRNWSR